MSESKDGWDHRSWDAGFRTGRFSAGLDDPSVVTVLGFSLSELRDLWRLMKTRDLETVEELRIQLETWEGTWEQGMLRPRPWWRNWFRA